ncbi:DUF4276 family protein [Cobetia amphilecti]|uniref:DUF4276 family protein n=1 Tax=Cobetia amphilecti TaxID=1055104 RepID=UPI0024486855|nr:DUF4276 family protein [Cobetia litoralis]MDH2420495.1 DUF4276 family protein [Cobetia litoralis]
MHFEFLVEGQTELTALSIIMPKVLGEYDVEHTWVIHKHRGIGRLPEDFDARPDPHNATLLHQLPFKIKAYEKSDRPDLRVIVLLDLDDKDEHVFMNELQAIKDDFCQRLDVVFTLAKEELEAWYLGDREALLEYNPDIDLAVLDQYEQDSICGTWEVLARADDPNVAKSKKRGPLVSNLKKKWSKGISPKMNVAANNSPSFNDFIDSVVNNEVG